MSEHRPTLFVVGSYMHGFTIRTPRFPRDGETILGTDSDIGPGGKGSNQAIAAARLGGLVDILACVGRDSFGDEARRVWQKEGISERWVHVDPEKPTGMAFITVNDQGQNRIIVSPGANNSLSTGHVDEAEQAIARSAVLVAQFESPLAVAIRALELARRHQVLTILNPAPAREVPDEILSLVDVITPNESETQVLTGSAEGSSLEVAAATLRKRGVKTVVLTLGEKGAYVLDSQGGQIISGMRVPVVDTTGAGDAFTGALAVALGRGLAIEEAVRFANLAGAFCVGRIGVVPGLGTTDELRSLREATPALKGEQ